MLGAPAVPGAAVRLGEDHPALRLLVNHDDAARETNYTAGAEKAMKLAKEQSWTVVSMKQDWKQIFSFQGSG